MKSKPKKLIWLTVAIVVGGPLLLSIASRFGSSRVTISPETTHIESPLDEDGYPDYVAALNAQLGEGVTPENNALALLWQAFGPEWVEPEYRERLFGALGIAVPPEEGDYLVDYLVDIEEDDEEDRDEEAPWADEQLSEAMQRTWSPEEFPAVAEWLEEQERPLRVAVEATRRTRYFRPLVSIGEPPVASSLASSLIPLRVCARALAARATLRLGEGEAALAMEDVLACHRLGRLVGEGPTLIDGLVGLALIDIAHDADLALAHSGKLSVVQLREYADRLRGLPPLPGIEELLDLSERSMFLDVVVALARGGPSIVDEGVGIGGFPRGALDWDELLRFGNEWYDRLVATLRHPSAPARREAVEELEETVQEMVLRSHNAFRYLSTFFSKGARTQRAGVLLVGLLLPTLAHAAFEEDETRMRLGLVQVALALAAHRKEKGSYPDLLEELEGRYIDDLPEDLFAEAPLKYLPDDDGYVLYSVGQDGEDDGGAGPGEDWLEGEDIVVATPGLLQEE